MTRPEDRGETGTHGIVTSLSARPKLAAAASDDMALGGELHMSMPRAATQGIRIERRVGTRNRRSVGRPFYLVRSTMHSWKLLGGSSSVIIIRSSSVIIIRSNNIRGGGVTVPSRPPRLRRGAAGCPTSTGMPSYRLGG